MSLLTTMGRLLCAVAVVAAGLWFGPPVQAAPTVTFVDCPVPTPEPQGSPEPDASPAPPPECVPAEQSPVRGTHTLKFRVDANQATGLRWVHLFIEPLEEGLPAPDNPVQVWPEPGKQYAFPGPESVTLKYAWDTNTLTPHNGSYRVRVVASTHDPVQSGEAIRPKLYVDNPPATPAAPRVLVATSRSVSVEWDEAPEPDVEFYTLYRARTSTPRDEPSAGDFEPVDAQIEDTSYVDAVSTAGAYWYRLVVNRRSVVSGTIASQLSPTSEEAGVVVAPTPTPEQTERPKSRRSATVRRSRARLTPRPLARSSRTTPAVPDAPFSAVLPYDLPEDSGEPAAADVDFEGGDGGDDQGPGALPAVAIGLFLVSAALALGRMPT